MNTSSYKLTKCVFLGMGYTQDQAHASRHTLDVGRAVLCGSAALVEGVCSDIMIL